MIGNPWNVSAIAAIALGLLAGRAAAGVPDPRFSLVDRIGVGDNSGFAVGGSPPGFNVTVKDVNNAPVNNATVQLFFSSNAVRVYAAQSVGTTVNVAGHTVSQFAATGTTRFALRTGGFVNSQLVEVNANGVVLAQVPWRSTDIDAIDGTTGTGDLSLFAAKFLARAAAPECNFDRSFSDVPDLGDFTVFATEYLSGATGTYAW